MLHTRSGLRDRFQVSAPWAIRFRQEFSTPMLIPSSAGAASGAAASAAFHLDAKVVDRARAARGRGHVTISRRVAQAPCTAAYSDYFDHFVGADFLEQR